MIQVPKNYHGEMFGRSSLALKHGITTRLCIIDAGYCGIICAVLSNNSKDDYHVLSGLRKGQIIVLKNCIY